MDMRVSHPQPAKPAAMRSELGRARGHGVTGAPAVEHWKIERLTAIALVPLTIWFVVAVIAHLGAPQPAIVHWAGSPLNAALLLALVILTFHHTQLGLQVVIGDYIHRKSTELALTLLNKGAAFLLALLCIVAIFRMAFRA